MSTPSLRDVYAQRASLEWNDPYRERELSGGKTTPASFKQEVSERSYASFMLSGFASQAGINVAEDVAGGVGRSAINYKRRVGQVAAYIPAELSRLTGKATEFDALMGEFSENANIRKWQIDNADFDDATLGMLLKSNAWGKRVIEAANNTEMEMFDAPSHPIQKIITDLTMGSISLAESMLLIQLATPAGAYASFYLNESASKFDELTSAGKEIASSLVASRLSGATTAAVEMSSKYLFLKWTGIADVKKAGLKGGLSLAAENLAEGVSSDLISHFWGVNPYTGTMDEDMDWGDFAKNNMYSALIGLVLGAGSGSWRGSQTRDKLILMQQQAKGLSRYDATKIVDTQLNNMVEGEFSQATESLMKAFFKQGYIWFRFN